MTAREGTLADPPGVSSCAVCGSEDCKQFHEAPYPSDYPFLPGGYEKNASHDVQPRPIAGERKKRRMRWHS